MYVGVKKSREFGQIQLPMQEIPGTSDPPEQEPTSPPREAPYAAALAAPTTPEPSALSRTRRSPVPTPPEFHRTEVAEPPPPESVFFSKTDSVFFFFF